MSRVRPPSPALVTLQAIREMLTRRPFEPLRITMSSGQVFEVRHPEMASLARSRMTVTIPDADGEPSDRVEFLSYLHIAHIQSINEGQPVA
jgi:hypothetical protein